SSASSVVAVKRPPLKVSVLSPCLVVPAAWVAAESRQGHRRFESLHPSRVGWRLAVFVVAKP
ncbi:hypothetical protein A2U01_0076345, partial [Trifolium medium]|nr:hypothetical protein [Trifolium medium]